jgi:hypothetical protein
MHKLRRFLLRTLLIAPACTPPATGPGSTNETGTSTTATATTEIPTTTPPGSSTGSTTDTTQPTTTTTADPTTTGEPCLDPERCPPACDTLQPTCPKGQKCTGVKPALDSPYTGTACVPDNAGEGGPPGGLCFTGAHGDDTCDEAGMCIQFGTGEGACLPFCAGPPAAPTCADPSLVCARIDHLWPIDLCVPPCDPLAYDCPDLGVGKSHMACAPASVGFGCILRGNLDAAADGEPCDEHRDCTGPALCAPPERVFACDHPAGCCAAYCDITDLATCPPGPGGHMCVPYYANPRDAPPGRENVGLCTLP